ncbi:unnamed protein product [Cuscuta campestris]|uniref:Uncharacterized protein n=1 Tax=Cuscuta campestris TaxID=132261 RepID=A0A484N785_9ASTE|nr:unnamed protein product [Cuscuta campestris]
MQTLMRFEGGANIATALVLALLFLRRSSFFNNCKLELPPELGRIHNVFHVSMLCRYRSDPTYRLHEGAITLEDSLTYEEEPVQILAREVKELRNKTVPLVKVLWRNHAIEKAMVRCSEPDRANRLRIGLTGPKIRRKNKPFLRRRHHSGTGGLLPRESSAATVSLSFVDSPFAGFLCSASFVPVVPSSEEIAAAPATPPLSPSSQTAHVDFDRPSGGDGNSNNDSPFPSNPSLILQFQGRDMDHEGQPGGR